VRIREVHSRFNDTMGRRVSMPIWLKRALPGSSWWEDSTLIATAKAGSPDLHEGHLTNTEGSRTGIVPVRIRPARRRSNDTARILTPSLRDAEAARSDRAGVRSADPELRLTKASVMSGSLGLWV
jgi:hypothetical protein